MIKQIIQGFRISGSLSLYILRSAWIQDKKMSWHWNANGIKMEHWQCHQHNNWYAGFFLLNALFLVFFKQFWSFPFFKNRHSHKKSKLNSTEHKCCTSKCLKPKLNPWSEASCKFPSIRFDTLNQMLFGIKDTID